jgi:transcriptional regulator with XRE-family HTH domain
MGGVLIKEARKRAGLTQADLAARAGTTQSAVARWEHGTVDPGFDTVRRLLRLCGLHLEVLLVPWADAMADDWTQAQDVLALTPTERAEQQTSLITFVEDAREGLAAARRG